MSRHKPNKFDCKAEFGLLDVDVIGTGRINFVVTYLFDNIGYFIYNKRCLKVDKNVINEHLVCCLVNLICLKRIGIFHTGVWNP